MRYDAAVSDASVVARLRAAGCVFAEDEAAVLLATAASPAELDVLVERRAAGEPLEQVVGWAEFAGLRIWVDPGVFVPRRRSEFLVSVAVGLGRSRLSGRSAVPVIVDLCCGTGALGLAAAAGLTGAGGTGRDRPRQRGRNGLGRAGPSRAVRGRPRPGGGGVRAAERGADRRARLRRRPVRRAARRSARPGGHLDLQCAVRADRGCRVPPGRGARPRAAGGARRRTRRAGGTTPGRVGRALLARARRRAAGGDKRPAGSGDDGRDDSGRPRPVVHTDEDSGATVVTGRTANN